MIDITEYEEGAEANNISLPNPLLESALSFDLEIAQSLTIGLIQHYPSIAAMDKYQSHFVNEAQFKYYLRSFQYPKELYFSILFEATGLIDVDKKSLKFERLVIRLMLMPNNKVTVHCTVDGMKESFMVQVDMNSIYEVVDDYIERISMQWAGIGYQLRPIKEFQHGITVYSKYFYLQYNDREVFIRYNGTPMLLTRTLLMGCITYACNQGFIPNTPDFYKAIDDHVAELITTLKLSINKIN